MRLTVRMSGLVDTLKSIREMNKIQEFEPNLTDAEKNSRKRFLIYRTDPSLPDDEPRLMSYYVGESPRNPRSSDMRANVFGCAD